MRDKKLSIQRIQVIFDMATVLYQDIASIPQDERIAVVMTLLGLCIGSTDRDTTVVRDEVIDRMRDMPLAAFVAHASNLKSLMT